MKRAVKVVFDREERGVIRDAYTHIRISFPDPTNEGELLMLKGLNTMVDGGEITRAQMDAAVSGFETLERACDQQSEVTYWRDQLKLQEGEDIPQPVEVGAVPLIANPADMAVMLAETREFQLVHVREALALLHRAQKMWD